MANIQKPKGTFDILPDQSGLWQCIETAARKVAALNGFSEIRFPTFEYTELFDRGVGDTTDIVQKEMYTFSDRDGRSMSLRPEGTASVVRSIVENGLVAQAMPLKLYYIGSFFRYEKPQANRSREFVQFGTEVFGADSPYADAEVIMLASALFKALGVDEHISLKINSIGCKTCRADYHAALKTYFENKKYGLCDTCKGRLETNPLRILDCKCHECKAIAADAPKTIEFLCEDCSKHFEKLKACLNDSSTKFEVDPFIVRGLDYYTKTVFEFVSDIGAQSTVCGGGRYDGLVKQLGGPPLCGVGFGMGITRLIAVMENANALPIIDKAPKLYLAPMGEKAQAKAFELCGKLKSAGIYSECDICGRSLKAQMKYADKIGALYTLVLGDNELEEGKAVLKAMRGGDNIEVEIDADKIISALA